MIEFVFIRACIKLPKVDEFCQKDAENYPKKLNLADSLTMVKSRNVTTSKNGTKGLKQGCCTGLNFCSPRAGKSVSGDLVSNEPRSIDKIYLIRFISLRAIPQSQQHIEKWMNGRFQQSNCCIIYIIYTWSSYYSGRGAQGAVKT